MRVIVLCANTVLFEVYSPLNCCSVPTSHLEDYHLSTQSNSEVSIAPLGAYIASTPYSAFANLVGSLIQSQIQCTRFLLIYQ
jgi:hypothetical protein